MNPESKQVLAWQAEQQRKQALAYSCHSDTAITAETSDVQKLRVVHILST